MPDEDKGLYHTLSGLMMVVIKVDKAHDIITDCQWKTYGCASAIMQAKAR